MRDNRATFLYTGLYTIRDNTLQEILSSHALIFIEARDFYCNNIVCHMAGITCTFIVLTL